MTQPLSDAEMGKYLSALRAMKFVEPDMKLGLGTGSTAAWLVKLLAHAQKHDGLRFDAVATSSVTTELATDLGIKIHALDDIGQLDLAIDGADEFDPQLNLIKGGGGALLQEKIVETAADQLVVITDASKQVDRLGAFPLPVEVVKFGWKTTARLIGDVLSDAAVGGQNLMRRGGDNPFVTDEGHYILDLNLISIDKPEALVTELMQIAGVVETGLFLGMTSAIVMGDGAKAQTKIQLKGSDDWQTEDYDPEAETALIAQLVG